MPHWDANSAELRENIERVLTDLHRGAKAREPLGLEVVRQWHRELMKGLTIPEGEHGAVLFADSPTAVGQSASARTMARRPTKSRANSSDSSSDCRRRSRIWTRAFLRVTCAPSTFEAPSSTSVDGRTLNGCAFIRSATAMAGRPGCGLMPSRCAMGCPPSCPCDRVLGMAMRWSVATPCAASGSQRPHSSRGTSRASSPNRSSAETSRRRNADIAMSAARGVSSRAGVPREGPQRTEHPRQPILRRVEGL